MRGNVNERVNAYETVAQEHGWNEFLVLIVWSMTKTM